MGLIVGASACVVAALFAWGELDSWTIFLAVAYGAPYGVVDSLYGNDIGFYLFSLPALVAILHWLLLAPVFSVLFAGLV